MNFKLKMTEVVENTKSKANMGRQITNKGPIEVTPFAVNKEPYLPIFRCIPNRAMM
jgi:hypothetical protein